MLRGRNLSTDAIFILNCRVDRYCEHHNHHMNPQALLALLSTIASFATCHVYRSVRKYQIVEPEITFLSPDVSIFGSKSQARARRDAIRVRLDAFGDNVDFVASRSVDPDYFGTKLEVRGLEGSLHVDVRDYSPDFYELSNGTISAFVYLMDNGQCMGKVSTKDETYYIEPTHSYRNGTSSRPTVIVYKDSDVRYPRMAECTQIPLTSVWSVPKKRERPSDPFSDVNADVQEPGVPPDFVMFKGSTESTDHVACEIKMVADTSLYRWMKNDYYRTAAYMFVHIKVADRIMRKTDLGPKVVRLIVKKMVIFTNENDPEYPWREESTSFNKFLLNFATAVDAEHCLSIVMCARQFDSRAIGLAYLARPDIKFAGGICSLPVNSRKYGRVSFNKAGITTINRQNKVLPLAVTLRSIAHEVGHSFGSSHDRQGNMTCSPGGKLGHFLMYEFAQKSGVLSETFSPCSVGVISEVVKSNIQCLKPIRPLCGNGIKERGEECDCGNSAVCEYVDRCCIPKGGYRYYQAYPECTYRRFYYYTCSAQEDACCTPECTISSPGKVCSREAGGCLVGKCDGVSKDCPKPVKVTDGTPCMAQSRTCQRGACVSKSICRNNGLHDCTCSGRDSCKVCCWKRNRCTPVSKLGISVSVDPVLPIGTSCGRGMQCSIDGRCTRPTAVHLSAVLPPNKASKWMIVLYVVPPVVALIIILVVVCLCVRRRRRYGSQKFGRVLLHEPSGKPGQKNRLRRDSIPYRCN